MKIRKPIYIDSHAHLDARAFDSDRPEVLQRAWDAGLKAIVTVGVEDNLAGIEKAVALAAQHDAIFATVGVHPHDAGKIAPEWFKRIRALTGHPKVVAIGETGLDYHYMHSPAASQKEAFRTFLRMARSSKLPVVIHTREADTDTVSILKESLAEESGPLCGVVHCFSGDYDLAKQFLDMGLDLSFTGVISFPRAGSLREVLKKIPLERILLETDCPYLAPVPFRGKRNEPAYVVQVAEAAASSVGKSVEEIGCITTENAVRLFQLSR